MFIIKAFIFDFDGTLADTLPICFYAFQAVFEKYDNRNLDYEEIKAMFGPSETGIIKNQLLNKDYDQAIEFYYKKYKEKHRELVPINEEIMVLLKCLKKEGYKLGIVTGKARRSLDISFKFLEMNNLFDVIVTGDDTRTPKPHPEGINKALEVLNVNNSEAVFLGDSNDDIIAGKKANVYTIGVKWVNNHHVNEFSEEPDKIYNNITDLMKSYKYIR